MARHVSLAIGALVVSVVVGCGGGTPADQDQVDTVARHDRVHVRHTGGAGTVLAGELGAAAAAYARSTDALTALDDDWRVRRVSHSEDGRHHVRLDQLHAGIKVWAADIVVHAGADLRVIAANGNLVRGLAGFDVAPTVAVDQAVAAAKTDYAGKARSAAPLAYKREQTELVIYPRHKAPARLAWHVEFFTELQAGVMPGRWNYFIDARTGTVLHQYNALDSLSQASGPGGNPNVARTWTAQLDVEPQAGGPWVMSTAKLQTYDMNNTETNGVLVTGPLNPIGDAAINDAHGFAEVTLNLLMNWFSHNSIDDAGMIIQSRVHYGVNFENAFWDGIEMTYGDGDTALYALSGDVDVVAHEINHGFTEFHSNLIYDGESGGMNESFSDVIGTAASFFSGAGDWEIGADLFINPGNVIRYMCDPTMDGISIDHYDDWGGQDPHFSSGISNKAFCRAARRLATGSPTGTATQASVRRAARVWVEGNANYWTEGTTFQEGCQGTMDAAVAFGYTVVERNRIRDSWADVGVLCDGAVEPVNCDQTFTTASGTVQSPNFPNQYPDNFERTWCIQPAGGNVATLVFSAFNTEEGFDFVQVRDGDTGEVFFNTSGSTLPPPTSSSFLVVEFDSDQSVTDTGWQASWGGGGTPDAATPDAAGVPDAQPAADARPDANVPTPDADPAAPDAGGNPGGPDADGGPGDGGGCCSTTSDPMQSLPLILVVGALLIRRRRKN